MPFIDLNNVQFDAPEPPVPPPYPGDTASDIPPPPPAPIPADVQMADNSATLPPTNDNAMGGQYIDLNTVKFDEPEQRDPSLPRTVLDQGMQGATFGFGDEAADALGALGAKAYLGYKNNAPKSLGGDPGAYDNETLSSLYNDARKSSQSRLQQELEQHPIASIGSQLGGALLTGGAGATTKAGAAIGNSIRSGSVLGRDLGLAGKIAKAGAAGATASGLSGFGSGDGLENRIENGYSSLGPGFAVGAAFPAGGALVNSLIGKPIKSATNAAAKIIARNTGEIAPVGLGQKALNKVYNRLSADYSPPELQQTLNRLTSNKDKSLLEMGGARTANLAEGAAQYPSGGAAAKEFFDTATGNSPGKLKTSIAKNISPSTNYYDTLDDIVKTGRDRAAPLYSEAFKKNQIINSPVINKILQTPEGKSALSEAARNMQNEMTLLSKPDPELTKLASDLEMASTGKGIGNGLKLKTLDYVKRSMDDGINKAYRAGDDAEARRIIQLKNGLKGEMLASDKTGLYQKALKTSGDYLSNRDAIEAGTTFLRDDPQLISKNFSQYGPTEKKAYKVGVLKAIRNDIDNKVDGQNVARLFSKPANRQKLGLILNQKEMDSLRSDANSIDNIYKLRNQITGNSRTAGRQIAAEEFNDETAQFVTDVATRGPTKAIIDKGISAIARQFDGLNDRTAKEVSNILYETDPKKKYQIVKDLTNLAKSKNPQSLVAANKLKAFYALSDGISSAKNNAGKASILGGEMIGIKNGSNNEQTISP